MSTKPREKSYVAAPRVPLALLERYDAVLGALSGQLKVAEAARKLGMSRNHFQTLMHRGLAGLLEALEPKSPGRPAKSEQVANLERQVERLQKENRRLHERVSTVDRLLGVATDMVRGNLRARSPRPASQNRRTTNEPPSPDEEPDPAASLLAEAQEMRDQGVTAGLAAAVIGKSPSTLRRWRSRARQRIPLREQTGPKPAAEAGAATAAAESLVRQFQGLIGAEALRHALPSLSRRTAARIKTETLTQMERERLARCRHVAVHQAGLIRGFDAMHVHAEGEKRYLLVASDASVPFRTSLSVARRYDGWSVLHALESDFQTHGPPLVLRLDRAAVHQTPAVNELLDRWQVLRLHGPARHPRYYGQLERQNREHRAWLQVLDRQQGLVLSELSERCEEMRVAWNALPRGRLGWTSAARAWSSRHPVRLDREQIRKEVADRVRWELSRGGEELLATRKAVEDILGKLELITISGGASAR